MGYLAFGIAVLVRLAFVLVFWSITPMMLLTLNGNFLKIGFAAGSAEYFGFLVLFGLISAVCFVGVSRIFSVRLFSLKSFLLQLWNGLVQPVHFSSLFWVLVWSGVAIFSVVCICFWILFIGTARVTVMDPGLAMVVFASFLAADLIHPYGSVFEVPKVLDW